MSEHSQTRLRRKARADKRTGMSREYDLRNTHRLVVLMGMALSDREHREDAPKGGHHA